MDYEMLNGIEAMAMFDDDEFCPFTGEDRETFDQLHCEDVMAERERNFTPPNEDDEFPF